jgi:PAS domain S-box-containing protein
VEISGVLIDWEGAPANLFFLKDTTERHALDEALKHALAQREAILETATVGVTFLVARRHQWLNRTMARMLGYQPWELLGQETRVHYASDEDFERVGAEAYEAIEATGRYTAEVQMKRKDGSLFWVQIDGTAIVQGPTRGTVWTYVDVTERRLAAEEMGRALARERELGELKTRLLSMASHEFRTPLAAILSSAELVAHYGDKIGAEEQRTILADLVAAARRMQLMLEDMLTLGQAEAGRLSFQPRLADIEALCRQTLAEVRSAHPGHRLSLRALRGGLRQVDPRLVQYILGNLLTNACKYSPADTEVRLELDCGEAIRIEVSDQGIGIPHEDLPHLFESFRRGSNAGQRPGSGLGLAIVKRCVDLHGGEVRVLSTLGAGSRFTVTLPASP